MTDDVELREEVDRLRRRVAWLRRAYAALNLIRHSHREALATTRGHWEETALDRDALRGAYTASYHQCVLALGEDQTGGVPLAELVGRLRSEHDRLRSIVNGIMAAVGDDAPAKAEFLPEYVGALYREYQQAAASVDALVKARLDATEHGRLRAAVAALRRFRPAIRAGNRVVTPALGDAILAAVAALDAEEGT